MSEVSTAPPPSTSRSGTFAAWMDAQAQATPDAAFLIGDTPLTYAAAWQRIGRLSFALLASGLQKGDRLLVVSANRPEVPLLVFAAARIGVVFTILHEQTRPLAFQRVVDQCEPSLIVIDPTASDLRPCTIPCPVLWLADTEAHRPGDRQLTDWETSASDLPATEPEPVAPTDLAFLVFTSGSTGNPRGVMLTHANVSFVCQAIQRRLRYQASDRIGIFVPLSFDYGLYQVFYAAMAGASLFIGTPSHAGPGLGRLLADQAITVLPGVPTLFGGLAKMQRYRPVALPQLRQLTNTGDHLPRAVIDDFRELLPHAAIYPMYGLTECKRVSILCPDELDAKTDSVGRALDGTEVFSVDPSGQRLPAGEVGEWVVRGPHVSPGYWRAPEETAKRFRLWPETGETVLFSGDQGRVDADGFLFFHARSDFMIKHKGHRLSPVELEDAALRLPEVETAGCVKDDARSQLCLFVGTSGRPLTEDTVITTLRELLEPVKIPDRVIVLDALPKTANQKVDRKALRQWLVEQA